MDIPECVLFDPVIAEARRHGIATQAWSPLGRKSDLLQNPLIADIGARLGKSVAQVVLRWQLQHGALPIPKSSNSERQRQNLAVFDFELSADDMAAIATLAKPDGRLAGQDPAVYEEF